MAEGRCRECHRAKTIAARGLCTTCYVNVMRDGRLHEFPTVDLDSLAVIPANGCRDCGTPTGRRGICNQCNRARKGLPNSVALAGGAWVYDRSGVARWRAAS